MPKPKPSDARAELAAQFNTPSLKQAASNLELIPEDAPEGGDGAPGGIGAEAMEHAAAKHEEMIHAAALRPKSASLTKDLAKYALPGSPPRQVPTGAQEPKQRGRRPGVGEWQEWGDDSNGAAQRPQSAAHRPQSAAQRPQSAAAARGRPKSAGGGSVASSSSTLQLPPRSQVPLPNLLNKVSFSEGYAYTGFVPPLRPGSLFFAALEFAATDLLRRGQTPLPIRFPPTLILGLPPLPLPGQKEEEIASFKPLWLWSDLGAGGGLRTMRQPIQSVESALEFLVSEQCAMAYLAEPEEEEPPVEVSDSDDEDEESDGDGSTATSEQPPQLSGEEELEAAREAARERLMLSACAVVKVPVEDPDSFAQTVRVLSVRTLSVLLSNLKMRESSSGGASTVTVVQRYVPPPVSRASVIRVQYHESPGHKPRPLRAFVLSSPHLIPRPTPSGEQLDEPGTLVAMTASSGTQNSTVQMLSIKGDEWQQIREAIVQIRTTLGRALNLFFEELVLDVLKPPNEGPVPWFALQVKAFRAVQLPEPRTPLVIPKPKGEFELAKTLCVGDHCEGKVQKGADYRAAAGRRIPYRWMVFDRLGESVKHRIDQGFEDGAHISEDGSQLHALARLVTDDQPGAEYKRGDFRRSTLGSSSRAATLRRLYTPASIKAGRPLVCYSAPRLYEEVPVCHTCYAVYLKQADNWKKKPKALISVASAPALGLIGAAPSELPSEMTLRYRDPTRPDAPDPAPKPKREPEPPAPETPARPSGAAAETPVGPSTDAGGSAGGNAAGYAAAAAAAAAAATPGHGGAGAPETPARPAASSAALKAPGTNKALAAFGFATPAPGKSSSPLGKGGSPGSKAAPPSAASSILSSLQQKQKKHEASHSLQFLERQSKIALTHGPNSPLALAKQYAFLQHCLCCNVLCKTCVLDPDEAEAREAKEIAEEKEKALAEKARQRALTGAPALPPPLSDAEVTDPKQERKFVARHRKMISSIKAQSNMIDEDAAAEFRREEEQAMQMSGQLNRFAKDTTK